MLSQVSVWGRSVAICAHAQPQHLILVTIDGGAAYQLDIAPTITRMLGLEPLDFDGRVLTEALQPER
jgi:hypothetical protein